MNKIMIADRTLCFGAYSFKEKIEIARQLEKLSVDTIEIAEITNTKKNISTLESNIDTIVAQTNLLSSNKHKKFP